MDLKAPIKEWHKDFQNAHKLASVVAQNKRDEEVCAESNAKEMDCELFAPMEEWDKSDREGTVGTRLFLGPGFLSKKFARNYDQIDWEN